MGSRPAAWVIYGKTLPQYQIFGFRLDLPLHRQSFATRFGVWESFWVPQYQYAIVVLLLLGKIIYDFGTIVVPCMGPP